MADSIKAVVLLSGGIDSTTCLAQAINIYGRKHVLALSISYGQKHDKELECARNIAEYYKCKYKEILIPPIYESGSCTLIKGSAPVPEGSYASQLEHTDIVSTYVPFRNGLFLSYATAIALDCNASCIMYGAHLDDSKAAYPDCTATFARNMRRAVWAGSGRRIKLVAPFLFKHKHEIVKTGLELKVPYHLTWSCYNGNDKPCGKCATCIDRQQAFEDNGVVDPLLEEVK